jgi:hypothetical protein
MSFRARSWMALPGAGVCGGVIGVDGVEAMFTTPTISDLLEKSESDRALTTADDEVTVYSVF